jgi:eukaryotic-like serine/threonine-protein kinase
MSLAPGQTLGRYHLLEFIGEGGMGEVYRARDTRFDRDVAIKSMSLRAATQPDMTKRFAREALDASRVVHPYVATVFDVVEHDGAPLLIMEFVKGRRFDAVLRQDRPAASQIARYGEEIAEALAAIHAAGIVHRDLKPGNVMVTDAGHVKVMDFGVAGRTPPADLENASTLSEEARLTLPGAIVGTPAYMSPEQLRGRETDGRSDLFALGIMLFEALTGHHPFHGGTSVETSVAILHSPPGSAEDRRVLARSGSLGTAILALLEKNPAARPQAAAEAARQLHAAGSALTGIVGIEKRRPSLAWIAAGILGGMAVLGYLVWARPWQHVKAAPPVAAIAATRPAVAVLPFEVRADSDVEPGRGAMLADLLAATVGESGRLRSVSPDRIDEALSTLAGSRAGSAGLNRVQAVLAPEWLVTGTLYREEDELLATVRFYRGSGEKEAGSFQVKARRASDLAQQAAARLLQATGAPVVAGFTAVRPEPRFAASEEAQLLLRDARRLANQSGYARAIAQLEKAIALDPGFVDAHVLLADLLGKVGYEGRARELVPKAMRLLAEQGVPPDSRQALQAAAVQGRLLGLPSGLESLKRLAQLYPDEPDTWLALASALHLAGEEDEAIAAVERAAALDPQDVRALRVRAQILIGQGHKEEARVVLDEAEKRASQLGLGAGLAEILEVQAYLKFEDKRYAEAAADYRLAARRFRDAGLPIRALGDDQSVADMNLKLWRLDEAEAGYRQTLEGLREAGHYSQIVDTLGGLGALLLRQRKLAQAETTLRQADEEAKKLGNEQLRVAPLVNLAWVYCASGRPQQAADLAAKAIEIASAVEDDQSIASAKVVIATAAGLKGRLQEAARSFQELADAEVKKGNASRQGFLLGLLAENEEQAERLGKALDDVNLAIKLLEPSGPSAELGNRYACRARVLALLGRLDEAAGDLGRAETMTLQQKDLPQMRDMLVKTRATLDLMRGRIATVLEEVSVAPGAGEPRSLSRAAAEILRARAQLLAGDAEGAATAARKTGQHPWASATEKAAAGLVRAKALAQLRQSAQAVKEARAVLAAGESMELPLTQAEAAALLLRLDAHASDAARLAQVGREQLQRYLDAIPEHARAAVRARFDVKEVQEILGS